MLETICKKNTNYSRYLAQNLYYFEFSAIAAGLDIEEISTINDPFDGLAYLLLNQEKKLQFNTFKDYIKILSDWHPLPPVFASNYYIGQKQPFFVWLERVLKEGYPSWYELPKNLISQAEENFRYKCLIDEDFSISYPLLTKKFSNNEMPNNKICTDKLTKEALDNIELKIESDEHKGDSEITPEQRKDNLLEIIENIFFEETKNSTQNKATQKKFIRNEIIKEVIKNIYEIDGIAKDGRMGITKQLKKFILALITHSKKLKNNTDLSNSLDVSDDTIKSSIETSSLTYKLSTNPDDILWNKIYDAHGLSYKPEKNY